MCIAEKTNRLYEFAFDCLSILKTYIHIPAPASHKKPNENEIEEIQRYAAIA